MLKSPSPFRASLARYSLYKLNRDGDKERPCLTPLPICTKLYWGNNLFALAKIKVWKVKHTCQISVPVSLSVTNSVFIWHDIAFCQNKGIQLERTQDKFYYPVRLEVPWSNHTPRPNLHHGLVFIISFFLQFPRSFIHSFLFYLVFFLCFFSFLHSFINYFIYLPPTLCDLRNWECQ